MPKNKKKDDGALRPHANSFSSLTDSDEESDNSDVVKSPRCEPVLETFDLDGIAQHIANGAQRIVVMCGAGISTNAGIPDFRTPGTGLYYNLQRFNLPTPESIFNLKFFRKSPDAFYELCKDMWPGNYSPTACHYFVRLLHDKGLLVRCYSQNIDSLEGQAGLTAEKLVAAHGNFDSAHVIDDEFGLDFTYDVPIAELKEALDKPDSTEGWKELRAYHGGLVKPKITFFGEDLPERFDKLQKADLESCDLLIVLGTSLQVTPFCDLLSFMPPSAPRLLINLEPKGLCEIGYECGFRFNTKKQNWRDVFHGGDCDAGVRELCNKLGWEADLNTLIESKGTATVPKAPWALDCDPGSSTGPGIVGYPSPK